MSSPTTSASTAGEQASLGDDPGSALDNRAYPIVLLVAALAAQQALPRARRLTWVAAAPLAGAGVSLWAGALREFRRANTTVDPLVPDSASALVTTGPFRVSRNPIYLGMVMALVANAVRRGSRVALLPAAALTLVIDRWQIQPEERALRKLFGAEYEAYRRRTRRWL